MTRLPGIPGPWNTAWWHPTRLKYTIEEVDVDKVINGMFYRCDIGPDGHLH